MKYDSKNVIEVKEKTYNKKMHKRIPKIWKVTNGISNNKTEASRNISLQKLKKNSVKNLKVHNDKKKNEVLTNNVNNIDEYSSKRYNFKENDRMPLVFDVTNKKSLYAKNERRYKVDFDKFYKLIEKTKDILGTLNKYEKAHRDRNYQIIYKMCKAK